MPRGKPGPDAPHGARHGINDYTGWFASDADMAGDYYGYDGPCPPWNDEIPHRYVSRVSFDGAAYVDCERHDGRKSEVGGRVNHSRRA